MLDPRGTTTPLLVRIIFDSTNTNGWISRLLSADSALSGKIAFIANLDSTIQDLQPGQVWEIMPVEKHSTYWKVQLLARADSAQSV